MGRSREAAMIELHLASREKEPAARAVALSRWTASAPLPSSEQIVLVKEWADLIKRQIPIEVRLLLVLFILQEADKSGSSESASRIPREGLVGQPALATLYYCSLHHYDLPPNAFASPSSIRTLLSLSDREFVSTCVAALVQLTRWPHVERLLTTRTLLGQQKLVCPFSPLRLLQILTSAKTSPPPKDLLCRIIRSLSDGDERLRLAEKFGAHDVVIESLVNLKDRQRLKTFVESLTPHTPEAYKALSALNNTVSAFLSF